MNESEVKQELMVEINKLQVEIDNEIKGINQSEKDGHLYETFGPEEAGKVLEGWEDDIKVKVGISEYLENILRVIITSEGGDASQYIEDNRQNSFATTTKQPIDDMLDPFEQNILGGR